MKHKCSIELDWLDLQQILDALESRAAVWENTLAYARGEETADDLEIEEYKDDSEPVAVIDHYRQLMGHIERQMTRQGTDTGPASSFST